MKRAVFLDRDGVINETVDRGGNWTAPFKYEELRIFPDVTEVLEKLGSLGLLRIVVTNQPDIAYGNMAQEDYDRIMADIKALPLDDVFVCLHGRSENCECKKPKPGMLLEAAKKWDIDIASSYMIGDTNSDMVAGKAAGCKTIIIDRDYNKEVGADKRVNNLEGAVDYIYEPR